ncbi:MAG: thioredoxin family protein [Caulobacteraceae bacterium]
MDRRLAALMLGAALGLPAGGAVAAPAPDVHIAGLKQLPTPLPFPYDPGADARAQVTAARARARSEGKLLLIDLGGNWCPDCRLLAAVMRLREVAAFVAAHYVVVTVDVGHMDKNLDIPRRFGVKAVAGVPSLLIVDRNGRLLDVGHTEALADARSMTPQALADWLARWTN